MAKTKQNVELSEETKRLVEEGNKIREQLGGAVENDNSQKKAPSKSSTQDAKDAEDAKK